MNFIKKIHTNIKYSSARDINTFEVLKSHGVHNVLMTGCPVWYDTEKLSNNFEKPKSILNVVVSAPAKLDFNFLKFLFFVSRKFLHSKKNLSFHHGIWVGHSFKELKSSCYNLIMASVGIIMGYRLVSLKGSSAKMKDLYQKADLHIGYRVHAHLYCLSQRRYSVLISEDTRGVSQSLSIGMEPILSNNSKFLDETNKMIDKLLINDDLMNVVIQKMRDNFVVMKEFLLSIKEK